MPDARLTKARIVGTGPSYQFGDMAQEWPKLVIPIDTVMIANQVHVMMEYADGTRMYTQLAEPRR